jgi:hypothetical protein
VPVGMAKRQMRRRWCVTTASYNGSVKHMVDVATSRPGAGDPVSLVVSCSASKSVPADPRLVVRPGACPARWVDTLGRVHDDLMAGRLRGVRVGDMYVGQHAAVVRDAALTPLVVSAGWGLLRRDELVAGYDATFTAGSVTSVNDPRAWWQALVRRSGALADVDGPLVVALSPPYLEAVSDDLSRCSERDDVVVVAACDGTSRKVSCSSAVVCVTATAVAAVLGGGRVSANARLGRWAAEVCGDGVPGPFVELLTDAACARFGRDAVVVVRQGRSSRCM